MERGSAQPCQWGDLTRERCLRVTLPHPNWWHLVTFHSRHRTHPSFHHGDRGFWSTTFFLFLWKVTQLTKVSLCLALRRKGDFSHSQLCKLTLTPESKAGIFLALVSLKATKTQLLRLCWRATENFGLRRLVPLDILCGRVCLPICRAKRAFPRRNSGSVNRDWMTLKGHSNPFTLCDSMFLILGRISRALFEPCPTGSSSWAFLGNSLLFFSCSGLTEAFNKHNIASFTLSYFKESWFSFAPELLCAAGHSTAPFPCVRMIFLLSTFLVEARVGIPLCLQRLWAAAKEQPLYIRDKTHLSRSVACEILVCLTLKESLKFRIRGKNDILPFFSSLLLL